MGETQRIKIRMRSIGALGGITGDPRVHLQHKDGMIGEMKPKEMYKRILRISNGLNAV